MVNDQDQTGTLYGLGVGPGDPELITLKAVRLLSAAPVIAYPAPEGGTSLAREIAAPHIPHGRTEISIDTPMVPGHYPATGVYDRYAKEISDHLQSGLDVCVLCEGDPFFFGSFMYIFERLADTYRTEVIPGVSSLGACAAAAGLPLVSRMDVMTILPGPLDNHTLSERMRLTDCAVIMKVGRHLARLKTLIAEEGLLDHAWLVEHASMVKERVRPLRSIDDQTAPYFSMILVQPHDQ